MGLAAFFSMFYIAIAIGGGRHEIVQAILAVCFIPAVLVSRHQPVRSAFYVMVLLWLWAANWLLALPDKLGSSPFVLFALLAVYWVARYGRQRISIAAMLVIAAGYCFVSPFMWDHMTSVPSYLPAGQVISWLLLQWLVLVSVLQLGRYHRLTALQVEERQQSREQRAAEEQEAARAQERVLIAREIHDVLAHSLTLINVQASAGEMVSRMNPEGDCSAEVDALKNIRSVSAAALVEVRGIVRALQTDSGSVELGATVNIASVPEQIEKFRQAGLTVNQTLPTRSELEGISHRTSWLVQLAIRRVIDEALTNVVRHQGINSRVQIDLDEDVTATTLTLSIKSWSPEQAEHTPPTITGTGSGLIGMRERVESLGGTIDYCYGEDYFVVAAQLPAISNR